MPEISVLVPAFRPDFLDLTLASVLAQSFRDFELIVSDDSAGDCVEAVVSRWADPRVRYVRNPRRQEPGANRDHLLGLVRGRFVKFVFDDDFLLPASLELLHRSAVELDAAMVFHGRHVVDRQGVCLRVLTPVAAGQVAVVPSTSVFGEMLPRLVNLIGEPSNILLRTETLAAMASPFGIDGDRMRFLTDVALYVNLADQGHRIVGVGAVLSAFRQHPAQTSAVGGSNFSAGLFEWELLLRWAADRGHLAAGAAIDAIRRARQLYREHILRYAELAGFLAVPAGPDGSGRFLTPTFVEALHAGWDAVDVRRLPPERVPA